MRQICYYKLTYCVTLWTFDNYIILKFKSDLDLYNQPWTLAPSALVFTHGSYLRSYHTEVTTLLHRKLNSAAVSQLLETNFIKAFL